MHPLYYFIWIELLKQNWDKYPPIDVYRL